MLVEDFTEIEFKVDRDTGKYTRRFYFENGLCLYCTSTREGLYRISLQTPGLVAAMEDMARVDGTKGRIMMYGFAGYFGVYESKHSSGRGTEAKVRTRARH